MPSSSSDGGLCAGFMNGTTRLHYGMDKPKFCDERDGKKYVYVTIGEQTWMAENLNYEPNTGNSWCQVNNPDNCVKYGRLYDWSTAMNLPSSCTNSSCKSLIQSKHLGICPSDYHIPTVADWDKLIRYVDGTIGTSIRYESPTAGQKLKAINGWKNCSSIDSGSSYACEDTFGFSALPGGDRLNNGNFGNSDGEGGFWWSADEYSNRNIYRPAIGWQKNSFDWLLYWKEAGFSIRCVQD
jgi:uncharacterized protein (TIGR02145 family)